MTQPTTPSDGTYLYRAPLSDVEVVAVFDGGRLTALSEAGEARTEITALAAAHVAHDLSYVDGVVFAAPAPRIGKGAAHALHQELGRAKVRDHYAFAAGVVGAPVTSLAALLPQEHAAVCAALDALLAERAAQAAEGVAA